MFKQIISIKNVGRFLNVKPPKGSNSQLNKLNIYYAENGSGKTTLSTILRSLHTGNADYILGKKSVYGDGEPEIEICTSSGEKLVFSQGSWRKSFPKIEIFDSRFIHDNVFRGSTIDLDHRRNLYQFILGEHGVALAHRLIELDSKAKEINSKSKQLEQSVVAIIGRSVSIEDFIALPAKDNIKELITDKNYELTSLNQAHEIVEKSSPDMLKIPEFRIELLSQILLKGIDDVSETAAKNITAHIATCMDSKGESWIFKGLEYIRNDECPFCKQNVSSSLLIEDFRNLFRESYKALKKEIDEDIKKYEDRFAEKKLSTIERQFDKNESLISFWKNHIQLESPIFSSEATYSACISFRKAIIEALEEKCKSPAEPIELNRFFLDELKRYEQFKRQADAYNQNIARWIKAVDQKKKETSDADLGIVKNDLDRLTLTKKRHEPEISALCANYLETQKEKEKVKDEKEKIKQELDSYSEAILSQHEESIKKHLSYFGAQFYPSKFQKDYSGGKPGFNFALNIAGAQIKLGKESTPEDKPSFSNTLSEGDKQSLAFAFFLSKLDRDPELSEKVVVFDDPICSLDVHRKEYTKSQILRIAKTAKQVILLSHDPYFLKLVSDNHEKSKTTLFKICSQPPSKASTIELWNVDLDTKSSYLKDFQMLYGFLQGEVSDLDAIARCIRPALESNLRMRFPDCFERTEWLGTFIDKVRKSEAKDNSPLYSMKGKLDELCAVNNYSKRYHHDQTSGVERAAQINSSELEVFVKKALILLR